MTESEIKESIKSYAEAQSARRAVKGTARTGYWLSERQWARAQLRALYLSLALVRGKPYVLLERQPSKQFPDYAVVRLTGLPKEEVLAWKQGTPRSTLSLTAA